MGNDETRYDRQVILDAYKESPDSVIGRRAMNAMMIAQLVEMKNQYAANYPMAYEMASQLAKYGNQKQDEVAVHISELLAWPYRVVGESFGILQNSSPMAVSNFGINQLAYNFFREHDQKSAIEFEFISKAESAHLAMALNATYFPFRAENDNKIYTDEAETSMMEGMMKVYWYAPEQVKRMQSIWNTNYTERNMLEFFDTKENIDILRTANMADKYQTPMKFRAILENLEKMEETDRRQKKIKGEPEKQGKTEKRDHLLRGCSSGGKQFAAYPMEIGWQRNQGIVRQSEGFGGRYGGAVGEGTSGSKRLVAVQYQQFLDFIVQGSTVHARFGTYIQQFQIDFICFQGIGISRSQPFGIHGSQLLCILQPCIEQLSVHIFQSRNFPCIPTSDIIPVHICSTAVQD